MDTPAPVSQPQSTETPTDSQRVQLVVPGMGSNHCAGLITASIERLPGVINLNTNIANHRVTVEFDSGQVSDGDIRDAVEKAGYDVDSMSSPTSGTAGEAIFSVPGMGSDHCAGLVSSSIKRLAGITDISTNIANHKVTVRFDPATMDAGTIKDAIEHAGYEVAGVSESRAQADTEADEAVEERYLDQAWKRLWFAAIPTTLIMVLMMVHMFWVPVPGYLAWVAVLGFPVVFLRGGWATHRSSWRSLTNRTANMDVLISMGSLPPYLIGLVGFVYPMTSFIEMAATIMSFHMLGRYLETRAKGRASQAIKKLLKLGAKTAAVLRDGQEIEVPVAELQVGDVMVVRPGAKVPTDGEIVEGNSHLDESIATGESVPVEKGPGDTVIGATINKEGMLQVRATRVGADTFLSQVVRLVEQAQGSKVPIQEFADRVTAKFVPAVILISLTSLVVWLMLAEPLRPILY